MIICVRASSLVMMALGVLLQVTATCATSSSQAAFEAYRSRFAKSYGEQEEAHRFLNFQASVQAIAAANAERAARGADETQGLTPLSDLSDDEYRARFLTLIPRLDLARPPLEEAACAACYFFPELAGGNVSSIDWVTKGAVTSVKNQAGCGACWAFSIAADVEGTQFLATGNLTSLSAEQLIACDPETGGQGCSHGGDTHLAMDYAVQAGLTSARHYPFSDASGPDHSTCTRQRILPPLAHVSRWVQVSQSPDPSEVNISRALARNGPLSMCIDASAMKNYVSGVDDPISQGPDAQCQDRQTNHAVLVVGFGVDGGKAYWKIKNSWGAEWGEQGFYRIVRGENKCGVATNVVHSVH